MARKDRLEKFVRMAMPNNYRDESNGAFKEYYATNLERLKSAEKAFKNLIILLLKDKSFPEPKVSSRLKTRNECIRKFDRKYREKLEAVGEKYDIQDQITDLIGLRIVCLYESDLDEVKSVLSKEFLVISETNKSKEMESKSKEFGYKGLHLDLMLSEERQKLPEYLAIGNQSFEVQIRTIVQDAWSEIDHKLKYKKQTPEKLQRRIHRLAALFELADQEFEAVRDATITEEKAVNSSSFDEGKAILDSISFARVLSSVFPGMTFYGDTYEDLLDEILDASPELTLLDLRTLIEQNFETVTGYKEYLFGLGHKMNPYTQVRYCLYASDNPVFSDMVFQNHRKNFDRWRKYGTVHPTEVPRKKLKK